MGALVRLAIGPDGSIFIAGSTDHSFVLDGVPCGADVVGSVFMLKLNPEGVAQWCKGLDAGVSSVTEMVLVGETAVMVGICQDGQDSSGFIGRFSTGPDGDTSHVCITNGNDVRVWGATVDDGRVVVAGDFEGKLTLAKPHVAAGSDIFVARFDPQTWLANTPPAWDFSEHFGGPERDVARSIARGGDGKLAIVGFAENWQECENADDLPKGGSDALFALYAPSGDGYVHTKTLCYGDLKYSVGTQVAPLPGSGFVWQGQTDGGVLFDPPHQIGPINTGLSLFITSWTESAGVTATYAPKTFNSNSLWGFLGLAADPLGTVLAGESQRDVSFPGSPDTENNDYHVFLLRLTPDLTMTP